MWSDGHGVLRVRSRGHETSSVRRSGLAVVWIHPRCLVNVASPFIPTLRTPRHSPAHSTPQFPNNKPSLTPLLPQYLPEPVLLFTSTSSLPFLEEFDNFHNFRLQFRSLKINRSFPTQLSAHGDTVTTHSTTQLSYTLQLETAPLIHHSAV